MKLCFSQALWFDRLRDYEYNAANLRADCELAVRYLQREISRDKRNLGALKLSNFLQPDNFDSDLALAKLSLYRAKNQRPATVLAEQRVGDISRQVEKPAESADLKPMSEGVKKFMEDFAERKQRKAAAAK
jgi:hypothetical protein